MQTNSRHIDPSEKFIDEDRINQLLANNQEPSKEEIDAIIEKAMTKEILSIEEVASLLRVNDQDNLAHIFTAAKEIKQGIYGNRIVMFAPLYVSNYCVNACTYCGYKCSNEFTRKILTDDELREEARVLLEMGHKRIVLEAGEDNQNCPTEYITHAMDVLYKTKVDNGALRRINVNVAATTVEDYKKLKAADIGTYILFQETYHEATYKGFHPKGPKSNYLYHLTAMDRAMEGGIDDVGIGALFGLYDYRFEVLGLMMHRDHLEAKYGVGPHTISVPRIRKATDVSVTDMPYAVSDNDFKKLVAIIRLAVPYTGIILSTREEINFREEVINLGVSQISAGSKTDVGGYHDDHEMGSQFETADHRPQKEIIEVLLKKGYLPSYCTACYRAGRTGDRFMQVAKNGTIQNLCQPNALLTLQEYLEDYADEPLRALGNDVIEKNIHLIPSEKMRENTLDRLTRIKSGERDLFF
jgi:2-iminoacetate synthase